MINLQLLETNFSNNNISNLDVLNFGKKIFIYLSNNLIRKFKIMKFEYLNLDYNYISKI